MTKESQAIEVEVVEIDGIAPVAPVDRQPAPSWQDWQQWQGRVRRLDARWWPLWSILGAIAIAVLLTFGLALAVVFLAFRVLRNIVTGFLGLFSQPAGSGRSG